MLPQENHPLTLAYLAGARARSLENMRDAMQIIRNLETNAPEIIRTQCKLAAEIILERK